MGRITKNGRCLIKTIKTENVMHKHDIMMMMCACVESFGAPVVLRLSGGW